MLASLKHDRVKPVKKPGKEAPASTRGNKNRRLSDIKVLVNGRELQLHYTKGIRDRRA